MPKAPITIPVAASRIALIAQGLPALGVVVWLGMASGVGMTLAAAVAMSVVMGQAARRRPRGTLRLQPREKTTTLAAWRDAGESDWRETTLRCDYLGPWLIGLRLSGRRLWLWPDSSDPASLRALRRTLNVLP